MFAVFAVYSAQLTSSQLQYRTPYLILPEMGLCESKKREERDIYSYDSRMLDLRHKKGLYSVSAHRRQHGCIQTSKSWKMFDVWTGGSVSGAGSPVKIPRPVVLLSEP